MTAFHVPEEWLDHNGPAKALLRESTVEAAR
jgi:hypothetical protein